MSGVVIKRVLILASALALAGCDVVSDCQSRAKKDGYYNCSVNQRAGTNSTMNQTVYMVCRDSMNRALTYSCTYSGTKFVYRRAY